jgi:hypothetical protein
MTLMSRILFRLQSTLKSSVSSSSIYDQLTAGSIPFTSRLAHELLQRAEKGEGAQETSLLSFEYLIKISIRQNLAVMPVILAETLKFVHANRISSSWDGQQLLHQFELEHVPEKLLSLIAKLGNPELTKRWLKMYVKSSQRKTSIPADFKKVAILNSILIATFKVGTSDHHHQLDYKTFMEKHRNVVDVTIITTLLSGYSKHEPKVFRDVFEYVQSFTFTPNLVYYTVLIEHVLVNEKDVEGAIDIFDDLQARKVPFDAIFLNTMVNGLFLNGNSEEAIRLSQRYSEFQVTPDHFTYTILIGHCGKHGLRER